MENINIGDLVEVKTGRSLNGVLCKITRVSIIKDSLNKNEIGQEIYKVNGDIGSPIHMEVKKEDILGVFRKIDL